MPNAFRTSHDVEIVGFVSVRNYHRMVTPRHQDDVAVLDGHGLVEIARVSVDAVKDKTLRRIDAMIVGLLEQTLYGDIIDVMLVGRIARRVPAWSSDLDDQNGLGGLILGQDIAEVADIRAFAANTAANGTGLDKPRRKFTVCGCTSYPKFHRGFGGHGEPRAWRQVNRRWRSVFKNAHASADFLPIEALGLG